MIFGKLPVSRAAARDVMAAPAATPPMPFRKVRRELVFSLSMEIKYSFFLVANTAAHHTGRNGTRRPAYLRTDLRTGPSIHTDRPGRRPLVTCNRRRKPRCAFLPDHVPDRTTHRYRTR